MHDVYWYGWEDTHDISLQIARAILSARTEYVWLLHRGVDYTGFDLNLVPDRFQKGVYHAWPSHNNPKAFTTWLIPTDLMVSRAGLRDQPVVYHADRLLPSHAAPILTGPSDDFRVYWEIDDRIDYSDFDFDWLPDMWIWEADHTFCLKDKLSLGYTHLRMSDPKFSFYKIAYHPSQTLLRDHHEITELNMIDGLEPRSDARSQRYFGNMEAALRTAIRRAAAEWLWVISDVVNYEKFDFSWLPDGDQKSQVHCWPSGDCEKGETFLIHVPTYRDEREFMFNFDHSPLQRNEWPLQIYTEDSLAAAIRRFPPQALYTQYNHISAADLAQPYPCLWEDRPVVAMNRSGSCSLVPRDCVVKREIYEYAHLERNGTLATDPAADVIFIKNGESNAAGNQRHLLSLCGTMKLVENVSGRLNSYRAAARGSSTDWFIAVFAKCHVTAEIATLYANWTPDYWQEPKHYIFHNHNLDNGLVYGHMAPIAYNRKLILENPGGLDITLAQPHTVVPILLSETSLAGDDWTDWRTAFREVVKLLKYNEAAPTIDSEHRLWTWENRGSPAAIRGARDARRFYESCSGDDSWLLLTVEWDWLRRYYDSAA